ncbi:hypothetical protein LCGC14_2018390, partial [marine sediment metagenome]
LDIQFYLAFRNKTLDLETLTFVKHSPNYLLTRKIDREIPDDFLEKDYQWEKSVWYKFLNEIYEGNQEKIETILEAIGDCLEPHYKSQTMFLHVGRGQNGKGTLLYAITKFLNEVNVIGLSMHNIVENFLTGHLVSALANICGDISYKFIDETGMLKRARGEDFITADRKFLGPITFLNRAKMHFSAQEVPQTNDRTRGYYRSFIIIHYNVDFSNNPDPNLREELTSEKEMLGLLRKVLEALKRLRKNNYTFSYNPTIEEKEESYIMSGRSDQSFCQLELEDKQDNEITKQETNETYIKYCKDNNLSVKDERSFGKTLFKEFPNRELSRPRINGIQVKCYKNIGFQNHNFETVETNELDKTVLQNKEDNFITKYYNKDLTSSTSSTSSVRECQDFLLKELKRNDLKTDDIYKVYPVMGYTKEIINQSLKELLEQGNIYEKHPGVLAFLRDEVL